MKRGEYVGRMMNHGTGCTIFLRKVRKRWNRPCYPLLRLYEKTFLNRENGGRRWGDDFVAKRFLANRA